MGFIGKLYRVLTAPSHDPPRGAQGSRGACCQLVLVQPSAAKGPDARRALPPRWEPSLPLRSLGVKASCALGGLLSPSPRPPSSQPFPAQPAGASCGGAEGGWGVPSWWEPLPLPQRSASSPACPAVWPCFASRLLPVLPLTDIVSVGIYISLTTLSPNGIKSKAGDK